MNQETQETFTVIGTAQSPNGNYKVRWTNDLISHYKRIYKQGCRNIEFFEIPEPMDKLSALEWMIKTQDLDDDSLEIAIIKRAEKRRLLQKQKHIV